MLADDFIERGKKSCGISSIVRPITRAENFAAVNKRDRAAASRKIESKEFHAKAERSIRRSFSDAISNLIQRACGGIASQNRSAHSITLTPSPKTVSSNPIVQSAVKFSIR